MSSSAEDSPALHHGNYHPLPPNHHHVILHQQHQHQQQNYQHSNNIPTNNTHHHTSHHSTSSSGTLSSKHLHAGRHSHVVCSSSSSSAASSSSQLNSATCPNANPPPSSGKAASVASSASSSSSSSSSSKGHQLSAQQLQHHHHLMTVTDQLQYSSSSAASSVSSVSLGGGQSSTMMSAIGTQTMHNNTTTASDNRRKSSLTSYGNLSLASSSGGDPMMITAYEPPPAPLLSHHQSPSRFQMDAALGLHLPSGGRLSIHSGGSDDDRLSSTCCLPPPSPAPNSDRYVIGMPAPSCNPSVMHQQHRSMSPSSRYSSSMADRYVTHHRDITAASKCNNATTPTNSSSGTSSNSNDSYAYLSAVAAASTTVHTPVKRYVPTPPPLLSNNPEMYASERQHTTSSTLPYRYRISKCCPTPSADLTTPNPATNSTSNDHYATPPRVRPIKCPTSVPINNDQRAATPLGIVSSTAGSSSLSCSTDAAVVSNIDSSSQSIIDQQQQQQQQQQTAKTCLHCSTMRRTTGVHQTTQTNGPISPIMSTQSNSLVASSASSFGIAGNCPANEPGSASPPPLSATSSITSCSAIIGAAAAAAAASSSSSSGSSSASTSSSSSSSGQLQSSLSPTTQHSSQELLVGKHTKHKSQRAMPTIQQQNHRQIQHGHRQPYHGTSSSVISPQQQQSSGFALSSPTPSSCIPIAPPASPSPPIHPPAPALLPQVIVAPNTTSAVPNPSNLIPNHSNMSRKQRFKDYIRRGTAKFFGVDCCSETVQRHKWAERQRRLAVRRFGQLRQDADLNGQMGGETFGAAQRRQRQREREQHGDRPDILPPAQTMMRANGGSAGGGTDSLGLENGFLVERKASVLTMVWQGAAALVHLMGGNRPRHQRQWSRSFAPGHVLMSNCGGGAVDSIQSSSQQDLFDGVQLQDDEVFFDSAPSNGQQQLHQNNDGRLLYMGERVHGWRTRATDQYGGISSLDNSHHHHHHQRSTGNHSSLASGYRGTRISPQILDGVLDNSRRPLTASNATVKLLRPNELDDRHDHRPFFTYWISTVQILVLCISLVCYGLGPIGYGTEQRTGQVLVTSLSLQQVQQHEPRNVWIGLRGDDLVHLGAKFAACMRRDTAVWEAIGKSRRQERETACCIRNDDSGCVQSSQAECAVRGLWPTKSISTWKKWSPGESGPGGRISGSVCGLDPKFCDAPASVAPYEWPDDITKWPICRKTNSFSQRFRFKDHTAEHMVCEVIGHPCCTGVYGECRITTREFCDFVNGFFHEEASLCSQVSCLNDVCGMFPFLAFEQPDQFYRLFTSLCLHAGVLHLALTVAFQHIFLADLERLIGPIRTSILYIGSGVAGNLTSAIFEPYKPEVGPLAALAGVAGSLVSLLALIHWRHLRKPHITLAKLALLVGALFGMGNLPWQQNAFGLVAGSVFGVAVTVALVPFVSFTKYGRQSKINFIWSCLLFHALVYVGLFIVFYIFPATFSAMGWATGTESLANHAYANGGYSVGGNVVSCDKGMCSGSGGGGGMTVSGGGVLHHGGSATGGNGRTNA